MSIDIERLSFEELMACHYTVGGQSAKATVADAAFSTWAASRPVPSSTGSRLATVPSSR